MTVPVQAPDAAAVPPLGQQETAGSWEYPDVARAAAPPQRILMAPGPSNLDPRVIEALSLPLTGHKDPAYLPIMDEVAARLRRLFRTRNSATFALPATGGSGMEASLMNLVEPGDSLVVASAGFFADRMVTIGQRLGAEVHVLEEIWGQPVPNESILAAIQQHRPKVVAVVHGETSTGVEQPLHGLGRACRDANAYLVVDAVASLAGSPLDVDELEIDICYSGSQKCISAPPGVAPITVSDRGMERIRTRNVPVVSWYFDLVLHARYWDSEHIYHHTAPVLNVNALCEALRLVDEEGLLARFARHRLHAEALWAGLEAVGLKLLAEPAHRLVPVAAVLIPEGIQDAAVRDVLLEEYDIEIASGVGSYAGRMWRIGVMGYSARRANIMLLLMGLEQALLRQGWRCESGAAVRSAEAVYQRASA